MHRYGNMAFQKLDGRTDGRSGDIYYNLSNAMHCIGQTIINDSFTLAPFYA